MRSESRPRSKPLNESFLRKKLRVLVTVHSLCTYSVDAIVNDVVYLLASSVYPCQLLLRVGRNIMLAPFDATRCPEAITEPLAVME